MAQPASTTTGTTREGGHGGGFPPFQGDTFASQLIWFAITFGLLYWLMSRVALPRVANIIETRDRKVRDDLAEAQKFRADSEAAGAAYEKAVADARAKARGIAQDTRDRLAAESDARRKNVEAELAGKLAAAEATIRSRTDDAMANVRAIAIDAASSIVERLIGTVPARSTVEAALDKTKSG